MNRFIARHYIKTSSDDVRRGMSAFEKNRLKFRPCALSARQKLIRQATHGW